MKMLWTTANNPVDWLIWLATGDDCQHFALLFDSPGGGVVFHFNLLGGGAMFYKTFSAKHSTVHSMEVKMTVQQEDALWDKWVDRFDGKGYNFFGAIFLGLMKLRLRIFGIPTPAKNSWCTPGTSFCDEAYQLLNGIPGVNPISPDENGMMTPADMWLKVRPA